MKSVRQIRRYWTSLTIGTKLLSALGFLLALALIESFAIYGVMFYTHQKSIRAIAISAEIQASVLRINKNLTEIRRLQSEFLRHYPTVGFSISRQVFVPALQAQFGELKRSSTKLNLLFSQSDQISVLNSQYIESSFYQSTANRYKAVFSEAVKLMRDIADKHTDVEQALRHQTNCMREILDKPHHSRVLVLFFEMHLFEHKYLTTRSPLFMQSAFDKATEIRQELEIHPLPSLEDQHLLLDHLKQYEHIAQEILQIDDTIFSKFQEISHQSEEIEPITTKLIHVADEEVKYALQRIDTLNQKTLTLLITTVVIGTFMVILVARVLDTTISQKIIQLTEAAEKLENGNLTLDLPAESTDEIGRLISSFNAMALRIKGFVEELEQKVFARTEDLEKANRNLAREVTERVLVAKQLLIEKKNAEAANQAKSTFLAHMSHELRTPLNTILGFSQLMERDAFSTARQRENLGIINRSGEHLLGLINDILETTKIEAGLISLDQTSFDLHQTLEEIEAMLRVRIEERNLSFAVSRGPTVPRYIRSDERKLRQVLINLLGNAVKYTKQGEIALEVTTDKKNTALVCFVIRDTGIGIPARDLKTIFDPFVQAESSHLHSEGTGLGLPISQHFVQALGGEISVESQWGKGSVFSFQIESGPADPSDVILAPLKPHVQQLKPGQKDFRILIVEDNYENRRFLKELLQIVGFKVNEATNGLEGLDLCRSWKPDLIFMDIIMPDLDGLEVTRKIKTEIGEEAPPIIAVSANAFEEDKAQVFETGCDGFIRKPVEEEEVFKIIQTHLSVEYIMSIPAVHSDSPAHSSPIIPSLTRANLDNLPTDLLTQLKAAATYLNYAEVLSICAEIRELGMVPVADGLEKIAKDFQFQMIIDLI